MLKTRMLIHQILLVFERDAAHFSPVPNAFGIESKSHGNKTATNPKTKIPFQFTFLNCKLLRQV